MMNYSNVSAELPPSDCDFDDRLNAFFIGEPMPPKDATDYDAGATHEQVMQRKLDEFERAMGVLDDLDNDDAPSVYIKTHLHMGDFDYGDCLIEKTYPAPTYVSPYEKCFSRVRQLESRLENALPDHAPLIAEELEAAHAVWDSEKERALNDRYRKFHLVDNWRAGDGREEYKATRRTVRNRPNTSLKGMSEAERAAHKRAKDADLKWKARQSKKGCTVEQIEAGLAERQVKRAGAIS